MVPHARFEIPLETLAVGEHEFSYELDDAFFAAFETDLLQRGSFEVWLEIEKMRSQYNLRLRFDGKLSVACDRCLEPFDVPLAGEDEFVIKLDAERADDDGEVIYVPYGTERFNVAKLIYDSIGLALPITCFHEDAGLSCDPTMLRYLEPASEDDQETPDSAEASDEEIPADSPWRALQALKGPINPN